SPTGSVSLADGGSALAGCTGLALTGSGSTVTAACTTSSLAAGTHSLVATYSGDSANAPSSSTTLSQVINGVTGDTNVALASVGAVASASSTYSSAYPVAAVNNNERAGVNWGNGGGWNDATAGVFPDWVQINFNGSKTLDHVVVYTLQDNYSNPVEPTDTMTFSLYGVTDFTVQGWNGSSWVTLGTVSGNNLVKRTVTFSAFTTTSIRVNITNALASYSRITEIEAWGVPASTLPATTTTLASSANPANAGAPVTLTASVTGSSPTGSVSLADGGSALAGCTGLALTGSGSTVTAACTTSSLAAGTHSLVATYSGDSANAPSSSTTLSQVINGVTGDTNVALASVGAVASASSTYSSAYPVAAVNNNERAGVNWGNGGGWNDATAGVFPDWVQINFNGSKTLDHVVVYTLQDNYSNPVEPTDTMTFSLYGVTDFTVQGWNGSSWVTLGTVSGNNLVKRTVTFSAFTTTSIRVNITNALASYSRITEIEAWGQ
ncbi:MAG: Ig-like domain-containing protein, partial [Casimicrobiaceae bacterium]